MKPTRNRRIQFETLARGGQIDARDPPEELEDINTTTTEQNFPHDLVHQLIDDDPLVQARIALRLGQLMLR